MGTARAAGEPSGAFQAGSIWAPPPQCWQIHPLAGQKSAESQVFTRPRRKGTKVCCRAWEATPCTLWPGQQEPPEVSPSVDKARWRPFSLSPKAPLLAHGIRGLNPSSGGPCQRCAAGPPKAPSLGGPVLVRSPQVHLTTSFPRGYGGGRQAKPGAD